MAFRRVRYLLLPALYLESILDTYIHTECIWQSVFVLRPILLFLVEKKTPQNLINTLLPQAYAKFPVFPRQTSSFSGFARILNLRLRRFCSYSNLHTSFSLSSSPRHRRHHNRITRKCKITTRHLIFLRYLLLHLSHTASGDSSSTQHNRHHRQNHLHQPLPVISRRTDCAP